MRLKIDVVGPLIGPMARLQLSVPDTVATPFAWQRAWLTGCWAAAVQDKVAQLKGALSDAITAAEELDEEVAQKDEQLASLQERNRELQETTEVIIPTHPLRAGGGPNANTLRPTCQL